MKKANPQQQTLAFIKKYKVVVVLVSVIVLGVIGGGFWLNYHNQHAELFKVTSITCNDTHGCTTKLITVPNNWAVNWSYDCSNVSADKANFVVIIKDKNDKVDDALSSNSIAKTNSKSGNGVTVMPIGGTYKLLIGSSCTWVVSVQRTSAIPSYDHETAYPKASQSNNPATPQTLLDVSGNGSQQTQEFTASGNWTVTYTYDCTNSGGTGNFQFDVANTDGSSNSDIGANELSANGGASDHYYDSGTHYLKINSECTWHVIVVG